MRKKLIITILLALPLLFAAEIVSAEDISFISADAPCDFKTGQIDADCIPEYIAYVIKQLFAFTGGICIIVIMIGGTMWVLGNAAGGTDKAKDVIRWGIIGMIISALSFFIIDFIISTMAGN